jgi:hypothetical protein
LDNLVEHLVGFDSFGLRVVAKQDAVAEGVVGDGLHVIGADELASA